MTKKIPKVNMDEMEGLDIKGRLRYLAAIDQLRELGVNESLSLPQLVVVGDQSSGKSSLLEGLTGFSFPIASQLCTRFATQIVLRRAPAAESSVKISIIPGPAARANEAAKKHLAGFACMLKESEFRTEDFARILDDAAECMGLPRSDDQDTEHLGKRFSDDVLKIEISGPDHHHLSVVDVPGLFHNPTKYQTKEDLDVIRNLITEYIDDPRTIILAVMDARNNLANQEVFKLARLADSKGDRTVGIITKCDALQSGDESSVVKIAQNSVERLKHGWFAVRNRSTQEISAGVTIRQRHENEKRFFETNPWNSLGKERVGIASLKTFLGQLLYEHIRREFPGVVSDIERLYSTAMEELEAMGPSRHTPTEQRQYLTRIATKYQKSVTNALSGNYDANLQPKDPLKLRMHIRNLDEEFASKIRREGHARVFRSVTNEEDEEFQRELDDGNIYDWIREIYRDSRGSELPGTVNPAVLENLFRQQTQPWEELAGDYFRKVEEAIKAYKDAIFCVLINDENARENLRARLDSSTVRVVDEAKAQLSRVLADERQGILQTVNHYFAEELQKTREARVFSRLEAMGLCDGFQQQIDLKAITGAAHLSNDDQAVNDIHDILKSYYKVAMKRFMDNVVITVAERYLLGIDGLVKNFEPEYVGSLQDEELEAIAAESFTTNTTRSELSQRLETMKEALRIVKTVSV